MKMRKILCLLILGLLSFQAFSQCEYAYERAAKKRAARNSLLAIGAILVIPVTAPLTIPAGAAFGLGAAYGMASTDRDFNTFGKVLKVIQGDINLLAKKVAQKLSKNGLTIQKDDPKFLRDLEEILEVLDSSGKTCMSMGFDKDFNEKVVVYNFRAFSKMVTEEYLRRLEATK